MAAEKEKNEDPAFMLPHMSKTIQNRMRQNEASQSNAMNVKDADKQNAHMQKKE